MYCGKTEEVLRRLQRAKIAGQKVQFLTPSLDTRRGAGRVISNGGRRIEDYGFEPTPVHATNPIATAIHRDTQVVAIDEIQFYNVRLPERNPNQWVIEPYPDPFGYRIVEEVKLQAEFFGRRVIWSGLDMNYLGEPFGPVPNLLAISTTVDKLTSVCKCGSQFATHTHRLVKNDDEILVGAEKEYEALCYACYLKETVT
jgi:thymidine kinase